MSYRVDPKVATSTQHTFEDKQYGYVWITPRDGGFDVRVKFSNGKKVDGDHFGCRIVFRAADNTPIVGIEFLAGLNGAYFGGSKEREFPTEYFVFDPEKTKLINSIEMDFFQPDKVDDAAFWEAVKKVAVTIYRAFFEEKKEDPDPNGPGIRGGGRP